MTQVSFCHFTHMNIYICMYSICVKNICNIKANGHSVLRDGFVSMFVHTLTHMYCRCVCRLWMIVWNEYDFAACRALSKGTQHNHRWIHFLQRQHQCVSTEGCWNNNGKFHSASWTTVSRRVWRCWGNTLPVVSTGQSYHFSICDRRTSQLLWDL